MMPTFPAPDDQAGAGGLAGAAVGPWNKSSLLVSPCRRHGLHLGQFRAVFPREAVWPGENGSEVLFSCFKFPSCLPKPNSCGALRQLHNLSEPPLPGNQGNNTCRPASWRCCEIRELKYAGCFPLFFLLLLFLFFFFLRFLLTRKVSFLVHSPSLLVNVLKISSL